MNPKMKSNHTAMCKPKLGSHDYGYDSYGSKFKTLKNQGVWSCSRFSSIQYPILTILGHPIFDPDPWQWLSFMLSWIGISIASVEVQAADVGSSVAPAR